MVNDLKTPISTEVKDIKGKIYGTVKKVVNSLFCVFNPELKELVKNGNDQVIDLELENLIDTNEHIEDKIYKLMVKLLQKEKFINHVPSAITVKNIEGKYIRASDYLLKRLGITLEEIIGKKDDELPFIMASKSGVIISPIRRIGHGVFEYQLRLEKPDGEDQYILMREKTVYDKSTKEKLLISVGNDITKMFQLQVALKMQQANTYEMLQNILCGVGYLSGDLVFQGVNPAFCNMFEGSEMDFNGKHISHFYELSPGLKGLLKQLNDKGYINNVELLATTLKGNKKHVMISAKILHTNGKVFFSVLDITDLKDYQEKIKTLAYYDQITDLPNRNHIFNFIVDHLPNVNRYDEKLGLLYIDLDGFKSINDTYGHAVGDKLLKQVGMKLKSIIRDTDKVARIGGDEFLICLTRFKDTHAIEKVTNKIIESLNESIFIDNLECKIGCSIGVSIACKEKYDGKTIDWEIEAENLVKESDHAMYTIKNNGKGSYCFYSNSC